jgi:hypothetical protein
MLIRTLLFSAFYCGVTMSYTEKFTAAVRHAFADNPHVLSVLEKGPECITQLGFAMDTEIRLFDLNTMIEKLDVADDQEALGNTRELVAQWKKLREKRIVYKDCLELYPPLYRGPSFRI